MATASTLLGQSTDKDRFSSEAAGWDKNPFIHEATNAAYTALKKAVPDLNQSNGKLDVLEIGCGTGVLSLQVARHVHEVVAVDAASGMIEVLEGKLHGSTATKNVRPLCVLLEDPEDPSLPPENEDQPKGPRRKYDLITSHLVLHHIPDVKPVLETMLGCLKKGGQVALTDFEDFGPEAKKFHPQSRLYSVERHGIKRSWISDLMKEVGFVDVNVGVGFTLPKVVERFEGEFGEKTGPEKGQGETMDFPFLICMGKRP